MLAHVVGKESHGEQRDQTQEPKGLRNGYGRHAKDDDHTPPTAIEGNKAFRTLKIGDGPLRIELGMCPEGYRSRLQTSWENVG